MNYSKECVALILAGGKGSRLGLLTKKLAKPAIPFGGKYRIIDFTLSNCYNSGINTIGVLTQYQPLTLNSYIGIGSHWDLDRKNGGVSLLPPYEKEKGKEWYRGTANAIFQNINFVDMYNTSYLLVLSGDHIYKMDYSKMIQAHIEKNAQATIAVIEVPWKEANRFGILSTNEDGKIIEFEEKPQMPKSNFASMGVYIFNWPILKKYLLADEQDEKSDNDFGKNIIPAMLKDKLNIYAYNFQGYWKDVGTVETLWEANMDLLNEEPQLDIYDNDWCIYSVDPIRPPQYIDSEAIVKNSLINEGCQIFGEVQHSVLFPGVKVGKNSYIKDSIIMHNVTIGENVEIYKSIVGENTIIEDDCIVSDENAKKINLIGEKAIIHNEGYATQNREIEK